MKFKYQVDVSKLSLSKEAAEDLIKTGQKVVFENFLYNLFGTKYPSGINNKTIRGLNKIFEKLDMSSEGDIEIDAVDIALLSEVFFDENITIRPQQVRLFSALQKNLEEAVKGT